MKNKIIPIFVSILVIVTLIIAIDTKANYPNQHLSKPIMNIERNNLTVCIDAGHGGKDDGASVGSRREKDDNLKLALAVKKELEKKDVKVIMTREKDEKISLEERTDTANKSSSDLFVSLHRNSSEDSTGGIEIWVKNSKPKADALLAENILDKLKRVGISDNRGVRFGLAGNSRGNYYVNQYTDMPSCLVEMGFMTNEKDNKLFDKNLEKYAKAIADGIIKATKELSQK